jgi:sugar phosphate isomerase/epimerase
VATHVKDGALDLGLHGLRSFTAEPGTGIVDFERIFGLLAARPVLPHLTLEDHGGHFDLPIFDPEFLARFPDLTTTELARLVHLVQLNQMRPAGHRAHPLPRDQWPAHCEERITRGLETLRRLAVDLFPADA